MRARKENLKCLGPSRFAASRQILFFRRGHISTVDKCKSLLIANIRRLLVQLSPLSLDVVIPQDVVIHGKLCKPSPAAAARLGYIYLKPSQAEPLKARHGELLQYGC